MSAYLGPFSRRLLEIRDRQLRRCWWCGEWAYALNDCATCAAPAERPHDWKRETA